MEKFQNEKLALEKKKQQEMKEKQSSIAQRRHSTIESVKEKLFSAHEQVQKVCDRITEIRSKCNTGHCLVCDSANNTCPLITIETPLEDKGTEWNLKVKKIKKVFLIKNRKFLL